MSYRDLREWLQQAEQLGEVVRLEGIGWDLEASAASTLTNKVLLFDRIPDYPPGYRLVSNLSKTTLKRFFLSTGWSSEARGLALTRAWKERLQQDYKPCPPKWVEGGPVMENIQTGKDIDLFKFPVPRGHEQEGGRYIGSADCVIVQDPDTGQVNLGCYRMQVHDRSTVGVNFQESKDGRLIMDKYHRRGQPCPVVAVVGVDPALFRVATSHLVNVGLEDMDFVGWLKGQPQEVFRGKHTGLPIPAYAEIAIEGEIPPGKTKSEGPFTEWCGMSLKKDLPFMEVKAVYHRNDPILTVTLGREVKPPGMEGLRQEVHASAALWDTMERAGVRGIHGVARYGTRLTVVSLHNLYAGHSRQAGVVASQVHGGGITTSYVIVVDADIDPTDIQAVMWAVVNRVEPKRAIAVLEHCPSDHLSIMDPIYEQKPVSPLRRGGFYISPAIIDACRPLEWDPAWHQEVVISQELKRSVREKCPALQGDEGRSRRPEREPNLYL